jgi:hypothetical protein
MYSSIYPHIFYIQGDHILLIETTKHNSSCGNTDVGEDSNECVCIYLLSIYLL